MDTAACLGLACVDAACFCNLSLLSSCRLPCYTRPCRSLTAEERERLAKKTGADLQVTTRTNYASHVMNMEVG